MIHEYYDISYDSKVQERKLDYLIPKSHYDKVIVYFHGGGLTSGNKSERSSSEIGQFLAKKGVGYVTADYRLSPEVHFPTFVEDAAKAISYVKENILKDKNLYVWGQSAGGYIALMLAMNTEYLFQAGVDPAIVKGWFIESAQCTTHFTVLKDRGEDERTICVDRCSPQYYVGKTPKIPDIHLIVYENDMPCRYEQNMLFYKSILQFEPQAKIKISVLEGGHCAASICRKDGEYPIVNYLLKYIGEK